ncbi:BglG family transcription antiterminator [Loigolactobacillus binensis]|uniref:BglG family transcription antiterminator n=1 Tax=Loigolactobacillus binensis TaxID=2559922 RepID=A0ABW3EFM2_9LACO|nr:BglG family transcription antiterminator [Loigolactobacillus binensis]
MRERLVDLLSKLIKTDSESINNLSSELNVTTRTIRNEIRELNEMLASNQLSQFSISKGIVYNNLEKIQQKTLVRTFVLSDIEQSYLSPQQRMLYLLLEFLTAKTPVFIVDIQAKLEISKSTMDGDMRDFRALLQEYSLRLITDPKLGARVVGNERTIRMMFCDLIIQQANMNELITGSFFTDNILTQKLKAIFKPDDLSFIDGSIRTIFKNSNLASNDNYRYQAIMLTVIWLVRTQNNYYISEDSDTEDIDLNAKQSQFINALIIKFDLEITINAEIKYLAFIIGSFDKNEEAALDNWVQAQMISVSLIEWMEGSLGFPFSQSENLFEEVYYHVSSLLRRSEQHINVFNPLKNTIKQGYPEIFNAVSEFTNVFKDKYHLNLSDDEKGYLSMYFSAAKVEIQKKQDFKYRIAVVCNYGMATGKLLAAKLEENFNVDVIAVLSVVEIGILKKLRVDLVFKTIDVEIEGVPSIKLNPIPSNTDLKFVKQFLAEHAELSRYEGNSFEPTRLFNGILTLLKNKKIPVGKDLVFDLQRVFYANHLNINEREVQPMLKDLINDNQIQLNQAVKDWKEAIKLSAQPLLKQGFITQSYIEAMINSVEEYGPYIVIGPSIALAHARPEDGANKLGVSITTLSKPVNFGNPENDPVHIVFCLAAIDNYSHLNVMKAIVQLINDPKKIEQLSKETDVNEFKRVLFNEVNTKETI